MIVNTAHKLLSCVCFFRPTIASLVNIIEPYQDRKGGTK
jgi:hypothetical protein